MKKGISLAVGLLITLCLGVFYVKPVDAQSSPNSMDIVIEATATEENQTLRINKYFDNAYTVDRGDGSPVVTLTSDTTHTYITAGTYTIVLSTSADRWTFSGIYSRPLVPNGGTTVSDVRITYMPSLAEGFGNSETSPGNYFFAYFNHYGSLTELPAGSFDTSNITTAGNSFFNSFNYHGSLTELPEGSFDTSNITTVGTHFFAYFNNGGSLTELPEGSFDTSNITTAAGYGFFNSFNHYGSLTELPAGSFDTSNITTAGNSFFSSFNNQGSLTELPAGSFDTSNITTAGSLFFAHFNYHGSLTELPAGSFDTSNITTAESYFFSSFNSNGSLTSLPESFKLNSLASSKANSYTNAFNSPNYTLNRKVSDLVAGSTWPDNDRNVFSDNHPGRCGVHENWLVSTDNACSVSYDVNIAQETYTDTGLSSIFSDKISYYNADSTGDAVYQSLFTENYVFDGWYTEATGGDRVEEVVFPDMDGYTLYAHRTQVSYTISYELAGGTNSQNNVTGYVIGTQEIVFENPTKTGYEFEGWYSDADFTNKVTSIPSGYTGDITLYAKWKKKSSSWSGGGGGGGGMRKDNCPDGDFSPSYYDGECGKNGHGSAESNTGDETPQPQQPEQTPVDPQPLPPTETSPGKGQTSSEGQNTELTDMHKRAYENGLTIYKPGEDAKFDQPLTRQQMAKISSIFGAKFLNQKADASEGKIMECSQYKDLSKSKGEMRGYVIQSCLMKNMGYAYDGVSLIKKFKPYDKMSVAQASVILSRMVWGTKYVISPKMWYQGHMQAVYDHGLIDDISDPSRKITRGEAFMMMYRLSQLMEGEK